MEFAADAVLDELPAALVAITTRLADVSAVLTVRVAVVAVVVAFVIVTAGGTEAGWKLKVAPLRLTPVRLTVSPVAPPSKYFGVIAVMSGRATTVKFVAYPVGGHFPADPIHQRDIYRRWIAWIAEQFGERGVSQD